MCCVTRIVRLVGWAGIVLTNVVSQAQDAAPKIASSKSFEFKENFDKLPSGWGEPDDSTQVAKNQLLLKPQVNGIRSFLYTNDHTFQPNVAEAFQVDIAQLEGQEDQGSGIIFSAKDLKHYLAAVLYGDGRVVLYANSEKLSKIEESVAAPYLMNAKGQANTLRLVITPLESGKADMDVLVNGNRVISLQWNALLGNRFGLWSESGAEACKWALANFVVQAQLPAPLPKDVIVLETFDGLHNRWQIANPGNYFRNNQLQYAPKAEARSFQLFGAKYQADLESKIEVLADVQFLEGEDGGAGVVFWAKDLEHLKAALLFRDGHVVVNNTLADRTAITRKSNANPGIMQGNGKPNKLRVVLNTDDFGSVTADIFVNDTKVLGEIDSNFGESRFGVMAESGKTVSRSALSNFVVRKLTGTK